MQHAGEEGYLPQDELLQHWRVIAPRKLFFLYGANRRVPLKAVLDSQAIEELQSYDPECSDPERGLDWFAPQVRCPALCHDNCGTITS